MLEQRPPANNSRPLPWNICLYYCPLTVSTGILFCTPCYGGLVTAAHFRSCLNLASALDKGGVPHDWHVGWNDSHIVRIRNQMASTFLRSKNYSHLFWLDADIVFTPDDVAKVWNLQADIGVGCYAMKKKEEDWFAAWKDGKLVKDLDQFGSTPTEVDLAGTGFMCIKREVLEELAKHSEEYEGQFGRCFGLFMSPIHEDMLESEDYNFCRRVRALGYKIMLDPTVRLGHVGQFTYGHRTV